MDEHLKCAVCFSDYDAGSHKPCMGRCGHSICLTCSVHVRCQTCPICRKEGSFQGAVINYGLLNIIENLNQYTKQEEKVITGQCSLCYKKNTKLVICIDCNLNEGILRKHYSESENEDEIGVKWNTENRSLAECLKLAELSSFCADCSVSSVHCRHHIGSFKNIQKTIFEKDMNRIKKEIKSFLKTFDDIKEQIVNKLDNNRKNISIFYDNISQFHFDQFTKYPDKILNFINTSNVISAELTNCHRNITNSIGNFDKKMLADAQSYDNTVQDEKIYYLKNHGDKLQINVYSTISNQIKSKIETRRPSHSSSIFYGNNVYIIGGRDDGNFIDKVEKINLTELNRKTLASLNEARWNPSACIHKGKLVVCGGNDVVNDVDSIEEYDFEQNVWTIIGTINSQMYNSKLVSLNNSLYLIGKLSSNELLIEKFNEQTETFEEVYRRPSLMRLQDCTAEKKFMYGKIFIIGEESPHSCLWSYNPLTNELIEESRIKMEKMFDVKLYVANDRLYAIEPESVKVFDSMNRQWNLVYNK